MTELRTVKITTNFLLEVASGNIDGTSSENKFGRNEDLDIGTEDVWDGGGTYAFYPTAGIACDIVSSDGSDTMAVQVFGLSATGTLQNETVTLNGATEVNLVNTYWRVFRIINTNSSSNVGIITVAAAGGGGGVADNVVGAQMSIGFNQTLMAIYTIPVGKTGYVTQWGASFDQGGSGVNPALINMELRVRPNSSISVQNVFQIKNHHGLISTGTSHFQHAFKPYLKVDTLSDIVVRAASDTADVDVHADFDIILVDD